ncbi:MAG: SDR family oxidoreductase [Spirochaetaceae bacterium]|nr:SDR family oxidoreductase [Spirochaetaceae bacterium]
MNFDGKIALVTGAARRLGKSIALSLAHQGADVILHYRNSRNETEAVYKEILNMGRRCWMTSHDLSDSSETESWFRNLLSETGIPDILVNSASEFLEGGYVEMSGAELTRSMNLHVQSPLIMIRIMHESGITGSVVNILDTRVADRDSAHSAYHLGKRGLYTLTRDLAVEMAPSLRINAVAPGVILPPPGEDETWIKRLKSTNPLLERGTEEDICDAVLYLLGAGFVTGQVIFVDGGRHLKGNAYGL